MIIDQKTLKAAIKTVNAVVEKRGIIPILSNIKMQQSNGMLKITGTDNDISVSQSIAFDGEPINTTIHSATISAIVNKLRTGDLNLSMRDNGQINITQGKSTFDLPTLPVEDFPNVSTVDGEKITVEASVLSNMLAKTLPFASTEETRYYLNGVFLKTMRNETTLEPYGMDAVSTDGHRLGRINCQIAANIPDIIIPRKTVAQMLSMMEGVSGGVDLTISDTKIALTVGDASMTSKLIDGTFPEYQRVIPDGNKTKVTVNRTDFSDALGRVMTVASDKTKSVKLFVNPGSMDIQFAGGDATALDTVDIGLTGEALEIGFNGDYMLSVLAKAEGDNITIELGGPASPAKITGAKDSETFVVMPMRV